MIEDLDGPEPTSSRGHMFVVSVLLLVGVIAGYVAVSSPELRGPFATPRPSVVATAAASPLGATPSAGVVPARSMILDESRGVWFPAVCFAVAQREETNLFVDGRPVTVGRPVPEPPAGVITWVAIRGTGPATLWNACIPGTAPSGLDAFSR